MEKQAMMIFSFYVSFRFNQNAIMNLAQYMSCGVVKGYKLSLRGFSGRSLRISREHGKQYRVPNDHTFFSTLNRQFEDSIWNTTYMLKLPACIVNHRCIQTIRK